MTGFFFWYSDCGRPLGELYATDIDNYIGFCSGVGWGRRTMNSVANILRMFFRFATDRGWTRQGLVGTIQAPRIYADESLPSGIGWNDVRRLFAALDPNDPTDVRDRAILLLMTIYGLRVIEVAAFSLDDIDWDRINTIRAWLGHVSLDTTHIYAEVDLEMKAKALTHFDLPGLPPQKRKRQDPGTLNFLRSL